MRSVDILLPTCNRLASFIMTLSGVAGQTQHGLHVIVADQSAQPVCEEPVIQSLARIIEARGNSLEWHYRLPSLGIAEQRDFLLRRSRAAAVLYLDDDVFMEPWVAAKLLEVLEAQECGFVGAFPNGLSFRDDVRPQQQVIEFWEGRVQPEAVDPRSRQWQRNVLHRAANLYHVAQRLAPPNSEPPTWPREPRDFGLAGSRLRAAPNVRLYKVAWIASCILYSREKLLEVGGFSFWSRLPRFHSGEEVLVQNLLMRRWGGCAILPSGAWHSELPSTVLNEGGTVDGHALDLLDEMAARCAQQGARCEVRGTREEGSPANPEPRTSNLPPETRSLTIAPRLPGHDGNPQSAIRNPQSSEPGLLSRLPFPVRRVALLRSSRIGDFVCATPAFRALRAALPEARVSLIALTQIGELIARCPCLDEFICFPGYPGIAEQYFDARRATAFFSEMQARQFDLAIQMHGSGVFSNPVALMLGARATAGFVRPEDGAGRLDAAMVFPCGEHTVRGVLRLLDFLGIPSRGEHLEFPLWPQDHAAAAALLHGHTRPFIGVHPGARDPRKIWPPERFALTACRLRKQHGGTIVIIGGPEERDQRLGERLATLCGPPAANLAGRESLAEMGAVIARLDVLVTNDSGPAHIAYALGTPTVTVFGFSDPAEWGPLDPERHRVIAPTEPAVEAPERRILSIGIEQVARAAQEIIRAA